MQRKFRISVDGRSYDVAVEEIVGEASQTSWPGSVAAASAAVASASGSATAAAPAPVRAVAAAGDEVAPLAGTVQSIDVTVGQTVKPGDKIATIEAMKMKTEVHARSAGKVVSIAVKPGDSVDTDAVLLTLA